MSFVLTVFIFRLSSEYEMERVRGPVALIDDDDDYDDIYLLQLGFHLVAVVSSLVQK
jgi:hypothetical protein